MVNSLTLTRVMAMAVLWIPTLVLAQEPESAAQNDSVKHWEGFRKIDVLDDKLKVLAAHTVVQIHSFGKLWPGMAAPEMVDLKINPDGGKGKDQASSNRRAAQARVCNQQKLRFCPIFDKSNSGTGFLQQGKILFTCSHLYRNWLTEAARANHVPVSSLYPPILIDDASGKRIFDSTEPKRAVSVKLQSFGFDPEIDHDLAMTKVDGIETPIPDAKTWLLAAKADFSVFEFSKSIKEPMQVPTAEINSVSLGTRTFLLGYSDKTDFFHDGKSDAPGNKLVVTDGQTTNETDSKLHIPILTNFTYAGMSGAPVITAANQFLGVSCHGQQYALMFPSSIEANEAAWMQNFKQN